MPDRRRLGTILLWLGVSAWLPFIFLLATGQNPPIYPFLVVHLTGVIGGTRLRALEREVNSTQKRHKRQVVGRILIFVGVLAWMPYLYQKDILAKSIEIVPYLSVHLAGVLGGIALLISVPLTRLLVKNRLFSKEAVGQKRGS